LHTGQTGAPHQSNRSDASAPPSSSSILALWINQGTQWFSGEPPEPLRTRCSLRQSPLMTRLPRSPGSTLVLRLIQETVHDFILSFLPPCGPHLTRWPSSPSNQAYLSSPHLEASPTTTFHACSSPAPTLVKPQPAPALLSQESVHTTLSITHHTRKRPSTGPRTTHGSQRCLLNVSSTSLIHQYQLEIRGAPLAHQLSWSRDELIIIDNFINKEI
jgi:hypothetical protein